MEGVLCALRLAARLGLLLRGEEARLVRVRARARVRVRVGTCLRISCPRWKLAKDLTTSLLMRSMPCEWVSERVSEWVSGRVGECVSDCHLLPFLVKFAQQVLHPADVDASALGISRAGTEQRLRLLHIADQSPVVDGQLLLDEDCGLGLG